MTFDHGQAVRDLPHADVAGGAAMFETAPFLGRPKPADFVLKSAEPLGDGGLWITYAAKRG